MSHQSTNRNHHPTGGLAAGLAMAVVDERLGAPIRQLRNHCAECGRNGGECQTHCQTLRRVCRQSLAQIAFARALVPYHLECFAGNQACQRWDCRLDELVAQRIRVVEPVLAQPVDLLVDAVQAVDRTFSSMRCRLSTARSALEGKSVFVSSLMTLSLIASQSSQRKRWALMVES